MNTVLLPILRPLAALLVLTSLAAAQLEFVVSLTSDNSLDGAPVRDQDIVHHVAGQPAWVSWPSETLALVAGDAGGDGLHDHFGDVDALHDAGPGVTALEGLYLSLISNEAGFRDGDVLRATPLGFEVHLAEEHFVNILAAVDAEIDVDAVWLGADGSVIFSLAEDEASSQLSGDDPGVVADGDILYWAPGDPLASIMFTEADVDAMVTLALGGGSQSTGDTKGLTVDPDTGAVLFSVQSPSAHDGSVFSTEGGGQLVLGHMEEDFGWGGAAELDALSVAGSRFAALTVSSERPQPGDDLVISLAGAEAGTPWVVLAALSLQSPPSLALEGWGGLVLTQDGLLASTLASAPFLTITPDGTGKGALMVPLGLDLMPADVVLQAVSPTSNPAASNPLILELAQ